MARAGVAEHVAFNLGLTRSQIATRFIPVNAFFVSGESAQGDVGAGALYIRGTSGGLRAVQDAAGNWWNLALAGAVHVASGWFGTGATALQAAIHATYSAGLASVLASPGTYTLTSAPLYMRPGVRVWAPAGTATITQANSANLSTLFDFATNSANGASLDGLKIDGNRANNTISAAERFACYIASASDVAIRNCELYQYSGHGIYVSSGANVAIEDNYIHHLNLYGIFINNPSESNNRPNIRRNRIYSCNWHPLSITRCQEANIIDNEIIGVRQAGMVVNITGTAVDWVSGPNFADIEVGHFIIHSGGVEALIVAKASNTSITISGSTGDYTNAPATCGTGDCLGSVSSRRTRIIGNRVLTGASLGISIFASADADEIFSVVEGNYIENMASAGISMQSAGTSVVRNVSVRGNTVVECGLTGSAGDVSFNSGMTIAATVGQVVVEGNSWISYGSPMWGLRITTSNVGEIRAVNNQSVTNSPFIAGGPPIATSGPPSQS